MKANSGAVDLPQTQYSRESERAVLGGILLCNGDWPELGLTADDFFLDSHRIIFRHLSQLKEQGKPADVLLLLDAIGSDKELDGLRAELYLAELLDGRPSVSNLAHYAEIIKNKAAIRRSLRLCKAMADKLAAANGDAADVLREVSILSAPLREEVGQKRIMRFQTAEEAQGAPEQTLTWIVPGLIARGSITELDAKVKLGKTTLVLAMVRAVLDGTPTLGVATHKTPVVYLTEQPVVSFRQAMDRAGLLGRKDFIFLPFTETCGTPWPDVASAAVKKCQELGSSLLIVDTLPQFAGLAGEEENNSGAALEAMLPLQRAAAAGIGILAVRHERKSGGEVGDSGRGSSAYAGVVDVVLCLRRMEGNSPKTRRLLQSLSRFSETPTDLVIDFQDGNYVSLGQHGETVLQDAKEAILETSPQGESEAVDLKELVSAAKVSRQTGQRAVVELVRDGALDRVGKGKRGDPFRYFIPENRFCPTPNIYGQKETDSDSDVWEEGRE